MFSFHWIIDRTFKKQIILAQLFAILRTKSESFSLVNVMKSFPKTSRPPLKETSHVNWNKLQLNCWQYCRNWKLVEINWKNFLLLATNISHLLGFYSPVHHHLQPLEHYDVTWLPVLQSENNSSFVVWPCDKIQNNGVQVLQNPK